MRPLPYLVCVKHGGGSMNKLFLISGPSGSGKTTIMRKVMDNEIVSFTTRQPRTGERDGVDYNFIEFDHFQDLLASGGLVEHSEYGGNYYGITKGELFGKLEHDHAFAIVDYPGAVSLADVYPNVVSIFIYAEREECKANMSDRGALASFIGNRLSTYEQELANRKHYDYVIRNIRGKLRYATTVIGRIIQAECGS